VDTRGVSATTHAISLTNAFRDDDMSDQSDRDLSMANAPESEEGSFVVPKII
jgi:aspartyl-tRNA(Asn)/glutamyl-tRNA(Gln) amidotransferase subunit C